MSYIGNRITVKERRLICCECNGGSIKETDYYCSFMCDCGVIFYYYPSNSLVELTMEEFKNGRRCIGDREEETREELQRFSY